MFSALFTSWFMKLLALLALLFNFSPTPGPQVTLEDSTEDSHVGGWVTPGKNTPSPSKDSDSENPKDSDTAVDVGGTDSENPKDSGSETPKGTDSENPKDSGSETPKDSDTTVEADDLADAARAIAQANFDAAKAKYEEALAKKNTAQQHLQELRAQVEHLTTQLASAQAMFEKLGVSDSENARATIEANQARLIEQKQLLTAQLTQVQTELQELNAGVAQAHADLSTARSNHKSILDRAAELDAQIAKVESAEQFPGWETLTQQQVAKVAEAIVFAKINEYRAAQGLPVLALTQSGLEESRQWSQQMMLDGAISHNGFAGSGAAMENVLFNYYGKSVNQKVDIDVNGLRSNLTPEELAESMFMQWKFSAGHDAGMLSPGITSAAVGLHYDTKTDRVYATMRGYNSRTDLSNLDSKAVAAQYGVEDIAWMTDQRGASTTPITPRPSTVNVAALPAANLTPEIDVRNTADASQLIQQRAELEQQIPQAQQQLAQAEAHYAETVQARDELQQQVTDTQAEIAHITEEIAQGEAAMQVVEQQEAITAQAEQLQSEVIVASADYAQSEAELAEAQSEVDQAEQELNSF